MIRGACLPVTPLSEVDSTVPVVSVTKFLQLCDAALWHMRCTESCKSCCTAVACACAAAGGNSQCSAV
jgi:hypothetical protein